jgi:hypothetical protein
MYRLLDKGEVVPCTRCDSLQEMIDCVKAFEQVHYDMNPDADYSPYTIDMMCSSKEHFKQMELVGG